MKAPRGKQFINELVEMAMENWARGRVARADVIFAVWRDGARIKYYPVKGGAHFEGGGTVSVTVTAIFCDNEKVAMSIAE